MNSRAFVLFGRACLLLDTNGRRIGVTPSSSCGTVGSGAPDGQPGNPWTVRPAVWLSQSSCDLRRRAALLSPGRFADRASRAPDSIIVRLARACASLDARISASKDR